MSTAGWTTARVADIAGSDPRSIAIGPFGSSLKSDVYTPSGVPVIRGQNISTTRDLDDSDVVFVPESIAAKFPACRVRRGDLVFPHRGAIGRVAVIGDREFLLSSSMMKLTPDVDVVDSDYLFYYFRGPGKLELLSRASTVGTPGIGQPLQSLRSIPVAFPALAQQRAIAEVLGALDDKIAGNTQLRKTAESLLAAIFGHTGIDTEPASEAEAVPLTDFVVLNPRLPAPLEAEPIYVDMQKLPTTDMSITDWSRRAAKGGARFQNGDTLLARITPCLENGKTGYVDFLEKGQVGLGSTEYIVLRARTGYPPGLAYFLARSPRLRAYAIRHMVGTSGRQRLSAANLALLRLTKPDGYALRMFEETAAALLPRLAAARDETRRLVETRDALLPQLMSGKLKVKDAEGVVEGVV